MSETTSFNGFPDSGRQFLRDITENNNKAWFEANKDVYAAAVLAPAQDFVVALGACVRTLDPQIQVDPRTDGRGVLMRFYRDTRFSKDKSPYKTNISGLFIDGQGKKTERPAYGFQIEADALELMAGMFQFSKTQLAAYRDAVAAEPSGSELESAVRTVGERGDYHLSGAHYKRVPAGYDPDHPRADLLRYAGLYAYPGKLNGYLLSDPELVATCCEHFAAMAPIYDWLAKYVAGK